MADVLKRGMPKGVSSTGEILTNTGVIRENGIVTVALGWVDGGYCYFRLDDHDYIMCNKSKDTYGQAYNTIVFKGQHYSVEKTAGTVNFYPFTY